jgi:hypothetical protein
MKKLMTITVTVSALTLLPAHQTLAQRVSVGIKGGLNRTEASMPLHLSVERTRAQGFHAGAFVAVPLTTNLEVQLEALYTEKGFRGNRRDADLHYELEGGYVEIPLLIKARAPWTLWQGSTPYVFAGPSIGFEVNCDIQGREGGANLYYLCDGPPVHFEQRKKLDYGIMMGAGWELPTAVGRLLVDVTYDRGIRDLADSADIPGEVRHGAFMISAGFATARGL